MTHTHTHVCVGVTKFVDIEALPPALLKKKNPKNHYLQKKSLIGDTRNECPTIVNHITILGKHFII